MQVVRNLLTALIVLPLLVVLLMPKKELYYLLEKKLYAQNIVISGEALKETMLGLTIEHPTFYLGGAPVATAKEISLWSVLYYSRVDASILTIAEGLPAEMHIAQLQAVHSVLSPFHVKITGESSLGMLDGELRLKERLLHLNIAEGGKNQAIARYLKKSGKGWVYESGF